MLPELGVQESAERKQQHMYPTISTTTTFRPILLLQYDVSTYPASPRQHVDLSNCSGTTFRPIWLLWDDISTCPAAPGRHLDLSCCSGTTFCSRPILLLWEDILPLRDDISTYLAALGRTYIEDIILIEIVFGTADFTYIPDEHTSCQLKNATIS